MENFINLIRKGHPREIKKFLEKYDHYLSPAALILGFIFDILTLTRVDLVFDNLVFLFHLSVSGLSIMLIHAIDSERLESRKLDRIRPWLPLAIQFAFGGIFSGSVVLYTRSASFGASWPFLIILAFLLVGNEFLKERYERLNLQLSLYFVGIFSYLIFAIPVLINVMGPLIFILSGVVSLVLIALIIRVIFSVAPWKIYFNQNILIASILSIYAAFNILYFTNIIPPIPLSSKDIVIAHKVRLMGADGVELTYEPSPWYLFYKDFDHTYHRVGSEAVYVYSSIYAPADLKADIVHEWSYYNEKLDKWVVTDEIQYPIFGGRLEGYRGFSVKSHISPGKWRVSVKTKRGQLLGRTRINVERVDSTPELKIEVR